MTLHVVEMFPEFVYTGFSSMQRVTENTFFSKITKIWLYTPTEKQRKVSHGNYVHKKIVQTSAHKKKNPLYRTSGALYITHTIKAFVK